MILNIKLPIEMDVYSCVCGLCIYVDRMAFASDFMSFVYVFIQIKMTEDLMVDEVMFCNDTSKNRVCEVTDLSSWTTKTWKRHRERDVILQK